MSKCVHDLPALQAQHRCALLLHTAVVWSVYVSVWRTSVSCKTAEAIEMPFRGSPMNHILDMDPDRTTGRDTFGGHIPDTDSLGQQTRPIFAPDIRRIQYHAAGASRRSGAGSSYQFCGVLFQQPIKTGGVCGGQKDLNLVLKRVDVVHRPILITVWVCTRSFSLSIVLMLFPIPLCPVGCMCCVFISRLWQCISVCLLVCVLAASCVINK